MKKLFKSLGLHHEDEMEMQISLKSKSYAWLFTMTALFIWVVVEILQAAMNYDYQGSMLPWLLFLGSLLVEDSSRRTLKKRATCDDEDYVAEEKAKRPRQAAISIVLVIVCACVAVFLAAALRYIFFRAGVLK